MTDSRATALGRSSFPGGNSGFARHFLKRLIPAGIEGEDRFEEIITGRINFQALDRPGAPLRTRFNSTVLSDEHEGEPGSADAVRLVYIRDGKLHAIRAKVVVMATGSWINRRVVRDLPVEFADACSKFQYAPLLVANVALNNWCGTPTAFSFEFCQAGQFLWIHELIKTAPADFMASVALEMRRVLAEPAHLLPS